MSTEYLTLGRGEIYFAPFGVGTTVPGAYKFLGNCPEFNLNVATESLDHFKSTQGLKEEDLSVTTSRTVGGGITCDDMKPANQALFFLGDATALSVGADTALQTLIAAAELDGVYQIGKTVAKPTGDRGLTNVVVTDDGVTTTYVLDTDYTLDANRGLITILSTGAIPDAGPVQIDYDIQASTRNQVVSGEKEIEGALLFVARNAAGADVDYRLPHVKMTPDGDLSMIGEDWRTMALTLKALKLGTNAVVYADDQAIVS